MSANCGMGPKVRYCVPIRVPMIENSKQLNGKDFDELLEIYRQESKKTDEKTQMNFLKARIAIRYAAACRGVIEDIYPLLDDELIIMLSFETPKMARNFAGKISGL